MSNTYILNYYDSNNNVFATKVQGESLIKAIHGTTDLMYKKEIKNLDTTKKCLIYKQGKPINYCSFFLNLTDSKYEFKLAASSDTSDLE